MPNHLAVLLAQAPDLAGGIIAVDINAVQVPESAAIELAADDAACLRMRVLDERRHDGCRPELAFGVERVRALEDAPTVVGAAFEYLDHFPEVLADVADQDGAGRGVHGHAPRIAAAE